MILSMNALSSTYMGKVDIGFGPCSWSGYAFHIKYALDKGR